MAAPTGRYKNILFDSEDYLSQVSCLLGTERRCWKIFCWLCTLVIKNLLHTPTQNPAPPTPPLPAYPCWTRSTGLLGLISSLRGLIGRPRPGDMWLCLGGGADVAILRPAALLAPHWVRVTLLRWPSQRNDPDKEHNTSPTCRTITWDCCLDAKYHIYL